ncbi:MAG TPA: polymer-forming cytoskeletal protein [Gemmatimonadaceae bacterium]|jgi:cytoskeletal protein CcmA (bactofilin family)|nr:polymer-forming cytoskeletal protein [Gemmatimonadaceae bacterium]
MAIFTKDAKDGSDKMDPKTGPGAEAALSIIAFGMKVHGDIETSGVIKIEGAIEGTIRGARQVLVGRQGEVKGDIHAREVVVGGKVDGTVTASERVEVQGSSAINGDIYTKSIVVLEGGRINGQVRMDDAAARGSQRPATDAKAMPVAVVR